MKKQHTSTIFLFLALAMVASLCVSPIAGAQPAATGGNTNHAAGASPNIPPLPPLQNVAALSAGGLHNCVLTTTGGVKCWGFNDAGQLGDGTLLNSVAPVDVVGLGSGVAAISSGGRHGCAITTGGGLKCWGSNQYGRLGDGTSSALSTTPVDVVGLSSGVAEVAGGGAGTCAVTTTGAAKCWGENFAGQLGDGSTTAKNVPSDVVGLSSGVKSVVVGAANACALTTAGGVKCWGYNPFGALGNGTTTSSATPVDVVGLSSGVTALAAGFNHVCALTEAGGVKCWGWNGFGNLGDDTTTNRTTPVDVVGLASGVKAITAGMPGYFTGHTCALLETGAVKCWGQNSLGELGDGTKTMRTTPVDVAALGTDQKAVDLGKYHSCVLTNGGKVKCWGDNTFGQFGMGRELYRPIPVDVATLQDGMATLAAGGLRTCGLTAGGAAKCWGSNWSGEVGDGGNSHCSMPMDVAGLSAGVTMLATGGQAGMDPTLKEHSCAIVAGGLKCWGDNSSGQLGDGTKVDRNTPVDVAGLGSGVIAVATGESYTCAVASGGAVKCWGDNAAGQLGDGTTTAQTTPVDVVGLGSGVVALGAGAGHSCALTSGGGVKCWGRNTSGQLGDGTTTDHPTPVDVVGLGSGVTALAVGSAHTCVITTGGGMKCWGVNANGRLGDGTTQNRTEPTSVIGLASGVTAIATGGMHTCAVVNGGAKCWGANGYGQLGFGAFTDASAPTDMSGLTAAVTSVVAGQTHTCALVGNGRPKCWGLDSWGQLGQGVLTGSLSPVEAVGAFPPAVLQVNYEAGRQDSFFTITGANFAPNAPLILTVNGAVLNDRLVTNPTGGYIGFLDTAVADDGVYTVMLTADASATTGFTLAPGEPLRVKEGGGATFLVPTGLTGVVRKYYMPLIQH